jgi:two-component system response regulator AtoC
MANTASVLAAASDRDTPPDPIVFGSTRRMKELRETLDKLGRTNMPVLIRGESGTGKEIIAQLIHRKSQRAAGPFVKVTCSAIRGTALERELFGNERGSVVGDKGAKSKIVQQAASGTLFLDEIGDLGKVLQARLLQLLQEFSPTEGAEADHVDVRMICATNRDLEEEIKNGAFRPDLFYRLNVASIDLPPLRERRADIPILVKYFLERYREKFHCEAKPIGAATLKSLEEFSWPGNIRQLENLIRRYVILGSESAIREGLSTAAVSTITQTSSDDSRLSLKRITKQASRELEREIISRVLAENGWNRRQTARALKISYRALLYKMKDAGLTSPEPPHKGGKQ